jgi:hypothetical protein
MINQQDLPENSYWKKKKKKKKRTRWGIAGDSPENAEQVAYFKNSNNRLKR